MPGKGFLTSFRYPAMAVFCAFMLAIPLAGVRQAYALTDLDRPGVQPSNKDATDSQKKIPDDSDEQEDLDSGNSGMPMPDPLIKKPGKDTKKDDSQDKADEPQIPVEIIRDMDKLPAPVQKLRFAIVEAAASGDIERLRPLLGTGADATQVAVGDTPEDPIAALKSLSGDKEGREVLGILLDIISTGAAIVDKGTPNETYVWPYFAEKPLNSLTPPEIVELYRIVTAADVEDMKQFGSYNFYRIGISPDGKWKFFVAGD